MRIGPALRIPSPSHKRISSENRSIDTVLTHVFIRIACHFNFSSIKKNMLYLRVNYLASCNSFSRSDESEIKEMVICWSDIA